MSANERAMRFPYTYVARFVQFPLGYYLKNQWVWKYYFIACVCCLPIFYKIERLAYSPENVQKWAEMKKAEMEEHEHH